MSSSGYKMAKHKGIAWMADRMLAVAMENPRLRNKWLPASVFFNAVKADEYRGGPGELEEKIADKFTLQNFNESQVGWVPRIAQPHGNQSMTQVSSSNSQRTQVYLADDAKRLKLSDELLKQTPWESTEFKKLFAPGENETVQECLARRIDDLDHVNEGERQDSFYSVLLI